MVISSQASKLTGSKAKAKAQCDDEEELNGSEDDDASPHKQAKSMQTVWAGKPTTGRLTRSKVKAELLRSN